MIFILIGLVGMGTGVIGAIIITTASVGDPQIAAEAVRALMRMACAFGAFTAVLSATA
jgi:hypothetical protein